MLGYRSNFVVQKHIAVRPRLAIDCRIVLIFESRNLLYFYNRAVGTEAVKGLPFTERTLSKLLRVVIYLMYMCAFMLQVGESKAPSVNFVQSPTPSELIKKGDDIDLWKSYPAYLQYVDVEIRVR